MNQYCSTAKILNIKYFSLRLWFQNFNVQTWAVVRADRIFCLFSNSSGTTQDPRLLSWEMHLKNLHYVSKKYFCQNLQTYSILDKIVCHTTDRSVGRGILRITFSDSHNELVYLPLHWLHPADLKKVIKQNKVPKNNNSSHITFTITLISD